MPTALTQTDVDRLEKAIARGVLKVDYDGHSVTYQSVPDMMKALAFAKDQIASASGKRPPSTFAVFDRG